MFGFEILRDISQGVINYNDLIHFHWFSIKWIVAKIFVKIRYALELLRLQYSAKQMDVGDVRVFQKDVSTFWKLNIPLPLKDFLTDTINAVFNFLNEISMQIFKLDKNDKTISFIDSNLKILGAYHKNQINYERTISIHRQLYSDIDAFKNLLRVLTRKSWDTNLFVDTFGLSPIENFIDEDNESTSQRV